MRTIRASEAISFMMAAAALILWTSVSLQLMRTDQVTTLRAIGSFWPSGAAANHGLNPYAAYPLVPRTFFPPLLPAAAKPTARDINLNPPALLPLFRFMALFDPHSLLGPWAACNATIVIFSVLLLMCAAPMPLRWWQICCALLMSPVRDTIWLGQIYGVMLLFAAVGWLALARRHHIVAGLTIGALAAMKPNFLVWPVFLWLTGQRQVAGVAAAMFAGLSLLPLLSQGSAVYLEWLRLVSHDQHWLFTTDISLAGLFHRAGAAWLGKLLAIALVLGSAAVIWRRRPCAQLTSTIALCVGILAAPLAWADYAIVLIPTLIEGLVGPLGAAAALLLMMPVRVPLATMVGPHWQQFLGTLIPLLPICLVLWRAIRSSVSDSKIAA